jgi:SAM-dependent methyltransferase
VELRETFDTVAEQYERARPLYPDELVAAIPGQRILEIGCGTGQLTRALLARGAEVTCVESGANMAAVARRTAPAARIDVSRFEDWEPDGAYDTVCCATAWHWLDPEVAPQKVHDLLRPGGALAVIGSHHVVPRDADPFFLDVQEAYAAIGDGLEELPDVDDIRHDDAIRLRATGLFDVEDLAWVRVIEYDAESYIDVLGTYSGHIAMTDEERATIYDGVRRLAPPGRTIRKHHLFCLHLARRID